MIIQNGKTIHLQTENTSYVMYRNAEEDLLNFHYGRKIADVDYTQDPELLREAFPVLVSTAKHPHLSSLPQEYPVYGRSEQRHPALQLVNALGNSILCLKYKEARVLEGQSFQMTGMPTLFGKADTLEVVLADDAVGIEVLLYYVVFEKYDVIARSAVIVNRGDASIELQSAYSANVDLPQGKYELIHFCGDWGRERGLERTVLSKGALVEICDNTGRGSRWNNPFVMVTTPGGDEQTGEVYGFNLIYSGNHSTVAQMDWAGRLRIQQGISDQSFSWVLEPGEEFLTPQSVICYSDSGFGQLSQKYHGLYQNHLMRSEWAKKQRPILLNSWEGCYFDFDQQKLLAMAEKAKAVGIELFVLDDGWFGKRDDAQSSLGDWVVNRKKLPEGLSGLAEKLNAMGLEFGLWFEPEMVSPDSQLCRAHPDWVVRVPQIEPIEYRYQWVLDLSKAEVCDYLVEAVSQVLQSANITYVKWDMNRIVCDAPFDGFHHCYVLGYYNIMSRLTERFPHILFEGCCSGGGRFDPGVLAYMPQIWASDNSDAIARLKIQYSTSMCYPLSAIGAHVSAVPNHQVGRVTSLKTRADVAYFGMFGYELDLAQLTDEELEQVKAQTAFAKGIQPLIREGIFHRLRSPFQGNECVWQVASED
ncbi:MAG: alpha-galactosidase, partial [Oscillospiraceae bacterium]|nr:alpha-galactosidase [Oscillospiraceae bacterium]